jgi:rhodanese-related sulfurtransferase
MINKFVKLIILVLSILGSTKMQAQEKSLESYLLNYNYESRIDMKINSKELKELLNKGEAVLIDIRFEEEYESWNMPFAKNIPLPELPKRLNEIDKSKIIVTACPHKDRAIIAMVYLQTKGYRVKYLTDGLIGLAESLRGGNAYNFHYKL